METKILGVRTYVDQAVATLKLALIKVNKFLQDYDIKVNERFRKESISSKAEFSAIQESFKSLN